MTTVTPPPRPTNSPPLPVAIACLALTAIRADPLNARVHSKRQIRQIARSIEAFGFNVPLLIDRNSKLIAGHGRLEACRLLGFSEVPTIRLDHLSASQAQAFMIADNRLTENATWDDALLAQSFKELLELDLDFSIEATGFEMGEIDLRIEQLQTDDKADEHLVLPAPDCVAVSRLGDLWQLGEHRILCGNALLAADYALVMNGQLAQLVFTDPPYNVPIAGHVTSNAKHREFAMAVGEMSAAQFTQFLQTVCEQLRDASTDGSIHYICMDWRHLPEILAAGQKVYGELKNLCVWAKDNAGMGSLYRSQHELVLVFKNGKAAHTNNVQLGALGRYRSNVWRYAGVNSFGRTTDEGNLLAMHPTVKPVAMIADALFDCSNRGDIVLDPFLGSGSTLMAAERTGRRCRGMELDPLYIDTAIRRWQKLTGLSAVLVSTGQTFNEVQGLVDVQVQSSQVPVHAPEPTAEQQEGSHDAV